MNDLSIPYSLTIYAAVSPAADSRKFVGYYEVAGGVALSIFGASTDEIERKAAERNRADLAAHIAFLGGVEAAKERMAASREARRLNAERKTRKAAEAA
jgi:hypothetical protein